MEPEVSELLSAFVDGERVDASDLATALAEPGAREALIDFIRLRTALADSGEPSEPFARRMRRTLEDRRDPAWRPVRLAAAAAVLALAVLGLVDLQRRIGLGASPDQPPQVARVLRYEPGVDWMPVQRR